MTDHSRRLSTWHLQLAIAVDAANHVLSLIDEPDGQAAIAYVLRDRLAALVDSCPFPEDAP